MSESNRPRNPTSKAVLLCLIVITMAALWPAWQFIFGPTVLESGDFAANGLQINDAKHASEWLGNYSRWGFNHPGPLFFYIYALGEWVLLNLLKVVNSPHQAHVAAGILLQASFVAAAASVCARIRHATYPALSMLISVLVVASLTHWAINSIWAPHVLFGSVLLLIASAVGAYGGDRYSLVLLVLASCFCVHGHVAQPILVGPVFLLATFGFVRETARTRQYRRAWKAALVCIAIVAIAVTPILLDAFLSPRSNLLYILDYLRSDHGATPTWSIAAQYLMGFWWFDGSPESHIMTTIGISASAKRGLLVASLTLAAIFALSWWSRKLSRKTDSAEKVAEYEASITFLRQALIFSFLGFACSLIWSKRITGGMYEFNAFFVYALIAVVFYVAIDLLFYCIERIGSRDVASFAAVATVALVFAYRPLQEPFSAQETYLRPQPVLEWGSGHPPGRAVVLSFDGAEQWPAATALALDLARAGVPYYVAPDWGFLFGRDRVLRTDALTPTTMPMIVRVRQDAIPEKRRPLTAAAFASSADLQPLAVAGSSVGVSAAMRNGALAAVGISEPTGDFVFTLGNIGMMQFRRPEPWTKDGVVVLGVEPFLGADVTSQRLRLYSVNGKKFERSLSGPEQINIQPVCNALVCSVMIETPDAFSPASKGIGADGRTLGFKLVSIGLLPSGKSAAREGQGHGSIPVPADLLDAK